MRSYGIRTRGVAVLMRTVSGAVALTLVIGLTKLANDAGLPCNVFTRSIENTTSSAVSGLYLENVYAGLRVVVSMEYTFSSASPGRTSPS